jgi:hypothetical protein
MKKSASLTRAQERHATMSRRHFLRGAGFTLALPALEALLPGTLLAADAGARRAVTASGAPLRMAFFYYANGALARYWWPGAPGRDFPISRTLQPLERFKDQVQVLGGLNHAGGDAGDDGGGDHARASGGFLSGVRVHKTTGSDYRAGATIDKIVARQVGHLTRFPSLQISCDVQFRTSNCDTGYTCVYQNNLSWMGPTTPVSPEHNPRLLFERLFGAGAHGERTQNLRLRQREQSSILDFVREDARDMQNRLGANDRQRLDEYLTSLREIERRVEDAARFPAIPDPAMKTPGGIPVSATERIALMLSILALAFQTDAARIATFIFSNDGCNSPIPELGFPEGHHNCTHHFNREEAIEKTARFDSFYTRQLAFFLDKLNQARDSDGTSVLRNSMIMYGGGIADGGLHTHTNLPILLCGGGGGTLTPGRYLPLRSQPISNLFLSMADRMGIQNLPALGDSTGRVDGL